VGRFGAHKLGGVIEMITKSALSDKEIVVKVDWSLFEQERYLEDVNFEVTEREPELFING
jgi:hypothetical protein